MTQLRILISGAGVAGNSLAFWLAKLGHQVTVVERFSHLRTSGLQLDLRGHGIEVIRRTGLESAVRSKAVAEQGMQMVDSAGRRRAYFPANRSGKGSPSFTSEVEIMRGDLCRLLYDATKDKAQYVFGNSIESFEERDATLEVRFASGKTDRFDILVGADGQRSRTRRIMLGSDAVEPFHPLDEYVAYYTVPRPMEDGEEFIATSYIATGGRFVLTRRHDPQRIQVYLTGKSVTERLKRVQKGDVREEKKAFAEAFRGAGWQVDAMLESLMEADDFYCECQGLVKLDPWYQNRVVLLGDAAYCPSASTGMGTSSAIVGAYILAGEIGKHCGRRGDQGKETKNGHLAAFQAYNAKFRPFMNQIQKGVGEPSVLDKLEWSPVTIRIVHWILWLASCLRLDLVGGLLMDQPVKGWDLPEYKEIRD
ncbi:Fad binding domain protein [Penicillium hispanicum]|uniref:Fad binding domain protein n=1 Tax=Penicillium hispanicum TaxID=1080232 RepID=UPI00253FDEA6|nr:Fad binding domain protein [Penicillium hispanicum]KAJ5579578.1 Fad binding domain protein [Penicillium hispanicum]